MVGVEMSIGSPRGEAAEVLMMGVLVLDEEMIGMVRPARASWASMPIGVRGALSVMLAIVRREGVERLTLTGESTG